MKLSQPEIIALNTFLHEYAIDLDFKTNLDKLVNNGEADSDMVVAEAYEDMDRDFLAGEISDLAEIIQNYSAQL